MATRPDYAGALTRARVYLPSMAMWLYAEPDNNAPQVGELHTAEAVSWYPASRTKGKLQEWYWVESETTSGWLPSLFGNVEFAIIPPLNAQAVIFVRSEIDEALAILAAALRGFADWLVSPQGQGVFA